MYYSFSDLLDSFENAFYVFESVGAVDGVD